MAVKHMAMAENNNPTRKEIGRISRNSGLVGRLLFFQLLLYVVHFLVKFL